MINFQFPISKQQGLALRAGSAFLLFLTQRAKNSKKAEPRHLLCRFACCLEFAVWVIVVCFEFRASDFVLF